MTDLSGLLLDCVQDLHAAETQALDRLPAVLEAVTSPGLRAALDWHQTETREQARRLEAVAALLRQPASGPACLWAAGILDDAERDTRSVAPGPLLDAALIGAVRKLEQAEVVSYETAVGVARALGFPEAVRLLEQTHAEERAMDTRLAGLLAAALGDAARDAT